MNRKALILLDSIKNEKERIRIAEVLREALGGGTVLALPYSSEPELTHEVASFFETDTETEYSEKPHDHEGGWSLVREEEIYHFFVLYVELDFEGDNHRIEDLWREIAEKYLFDNSLGEEGKWRRFCGNELSSKRIYIAPVRKDNRDVIKSIFKVFLNKQIDDIRVYGNREVKLRYYLTALKLPYTCMDSSERLLPACSNIYKMAEELGPDRLYLSGEVLSLMPENIKNNLLEDEEEGSLFSYSFDLMT